MPSTAIDSFLFGNFFSSEPMRQVFSDDNRIRKYLDFEAALATVQGRLGIIPADAAAEIAANCTLDRIDMVKLRAQTERAGSPVLGMVQQLAAACRDGRGEYCHWGATTQDVTDTAIHVAGPRSAGSHRRRSGRSVRFACGARAAPSRHADGRTKLSAARGADHVRIQDGRSPVSNRASPPASHRNVAARAGRRVLSGAVGTLASLQAADSTRRRR